MAAHGDASGRVNRILPLILFCLLTCRLSLAQANETREYTLSVVPQATSLVIHERWTPIVDYLSEQTGVTIKLKQYESIPAFEAGILSGEVDFAYMNPYHCVMAHNERGYLPLVCDGSKRLVGILVVPTNSKVKTVQDLSGETCVFPAPNAFGASLYMRALLAEKEDVEIIPNYVTTHDNVYRHVLFGTAAAGGGVRRTFGQQPREIRDGLRVLYATPGVAPHPLASHPRVPVEVRNAVTTALVALSHNESGRQLLKGIPMTAPIIADYQRDYAGLEDLHLNDYIVLESRDANP